MRTKFFKHTIDGGFDTPETYKLYLAAHTYAGNNTLAVIAMVREDGYDEDFGTVTVNLPSGEADGTHAYIDTNNCPWAEQMLIDNGFAKPTGKYGISGFCTYPLYEFDLTKFNK